MDMEGNKLVEFEEVLVEFSDFKLYIEKFSIKNPITLVSGPNGAGKSTFFKLLLGLLKPEKGECRFRKDLKLGYVPQNYRSCLFPWMTLEENLSSHKIGRKEIPKQLSMLEFLGLGDSFRKNKPSELSGGQCQRLALVRELAVSADLVILDEPFSSLDKNTVPKAEELILNYVERGGYVIITTHTDCPNLLEAKPVQVHIERESEGLSKLVEFT